MRKLLIYTHNLPGGGGRSDGGTWEERCAQWWTVQNDGAALNLTEVTFQKLESAVTQSFQNHSSPRVVACPCDDDPLFEPKNEPVGCVLIADEDTGVLGKRFILIMILSLLCTVWMCLLLKWLRDSRHRNDAAEQPDGIGDDDVWSLSGWAAVSDEDEEYENEHCERKATIRAKRTDKRRPKFFEVINPDGKAVIGRLMKVPGLDPPTPDPSVHSEKFSGGLASRCTSWDKPTAGEGSGHSMRQFSQSWLPLTSLNGSDAPPGSSIAARTDERSNDGEDVVFGDAVTIEESNEDDVVGGELGRAAETDGAEGESPSVDSDIEIQPWDLALEMEGGGLGHDADIDAGPASASRVQ